MSSDGSLGERLDRDYLRAMKAQDHIRLSTLRMVRNAVQGREKALLRPLTEPEIAEVVAREARLRRESLSEFERGGRLDLADRESRALAVLDDYLPDQLSTAQIREVVEQVIAELGDQVPPNRAEALGPVMRAVMGRVKGRADGGAVNGIVRSILAPEPGR